MDIFDLEELMHDDPSDDPDWTDKVQRARERVATFNALAPAQQLERLRRPCDGSCLLPEVRAVALRPFD
ncbi:hypothetical protein [Brachybacterium subflavum]|uniref:hypothetical protein n=1 Tax=Brachybacterium subflavum TaxID=2585206 RepID=UPI0012661058|nr:hypothetical protein [Brachybacterium subflavum]